jgi:integrase
VSQALYRRCGCRDENGRQYAAKCPELAANPKHGSWALYFSNGSDPRTGKRRQYSKAGFKTKKAADQALTELKHQLGKGTYVEPSKKMLAEYAPEIMARRLITGSGLKPTTAATYQRYVEQDIVPSRLGEMRLTDIRRSHVNAWVADLSKAGRGAVTVRRALATLRMIFTQAVKDEIIPANPALMVDKPAVAETGEKHWEPEHVGAFLERCGRHRLGPLFELATYTGLRRGEICGLHWSDVDLAARTVVVRHNRVSVDGRVTETTTKTRSGRRTVPLSDAGVAALLTWQLRQAAEQEAAQEAWETQGHVFTMEDGRPLDPAYVTRLFQVIRTQDEPLPELTFHGLRHSAASLMLAGGADISTVSKLLGHASISITADVYAHLVAAVGQQAVNGAANLIARTVLAQPDVKTDAG